MAESFEQFIIEHENDDVAKLLFKSASFGDIDVKKAVATIEGRRRAKVKIPEWYRNTAVMYPSGVALEQCSSQGTALYKQRFIKSTSKILDITGGLGVDDYFFAKKAASVLYMEKNSTLCDAAVHNFNALNTYNIFVINSNIITDNIRTQHFDLIYADPDRRPDSSRRVYSISDCSPDILAIKDELFTLSDTILLKLSPMEDIRNTLAQLPETVEVHIISIDNECKELLLLMKKGATISPEDVPITAADISSKDDNILWSITFTLGEEASASAIYATKEIGDYVFQPGKSVLKGGAFKLLCSKYGLHKFDPSTHLYCSNTYCTDSFPGKIFKRIDTIPFSSAGIKMLAAHYPQCNIVAKNLPISTKELRLRLKTKDGGDIYVFAAKTCNGQAQMIVCKKV